MPGERYLLSGVTLTVTEALALLGRISGREEHPRTPARRRWRWPPRPASSCVARVRRRRPPVCREMVRTLLHGHAYDGSRATRELGLVYTPLEESLRRTVDWYVAEGLVPQPAPAVVRPGRHHAAASLQLVVEELLAVALVAERDGHEVERREAAEHRRDPHQGLADDDLAPADAHRQSTSGASPTHSAVSARSTISTPSTMNVSPTATPTASTRTPRETNSATATLIRASRSSGGTGGLDAGATSGAAGVAERVLAARAPAPGPSGRGARGAGRRRG